MHWHIMYNNPDTEETQRFVSMIDLFFFYCLNVRNMSEWALKRKSDLKPYTSPILLSESFLHLVMQVLRT